ncbi:MAG TPA: hypothetical protein PK147_03075 [Saprospiraceae bacterium]|nr:hypothetical protein [Saprospiraceae bacterium]MCB9329319.1 hypothetical protein [Lewinellaceae bacterium]HPK10482.1 hypothetical protein [Saprospiraceae bacterium]HPQ20803.1 hypothetical protein [Saprospiraceae bacterium]HRX29552.1 hypothetical protein [Saprospiraceae bacterium]
MKKLLLISILASINLYFTSCSKDDNPTDETNGTVEVEFDNIALVDGIQRQLSMVTPGSSDYQYTNALNQKFNINLLRYYISNIVLEGPNGEYFEDKVSVTTTAVKGIYLVDESNHTSSLITLSDVPAGEYNKIKFTVGVDENGVTEGAAGGILDPATCNMFWNWNSGYIALKFEGQSPDSNGGVSGTETLDENSIHGIAYHIGGWRDIEGTAFVYNNKALSLDFDTNAKVKYGEQPHVHIVMDVLTLFNGENDIDFTGNHNVHKPLDGVDMANNIPNAFTFDHIHQ